MNSLLIALNGLKLALKSREAIFWLFIGPLIFVTFFGILFKPQPPERVRIDLVNRDRTRAIASTIAAALRDDGMIVTEQRDVVSGHTTVVVPEGAGAALASDRSVSLELHAGAEETRAEGDLRFKITRALVASALGVKATDPPGPLAVVRTDVGTKAPIMTAGFQRSVPSYMVMFVFLNLLVSGAGIAEERRLGLLRRLGIAPVAKWEIVTGKLLSRFFVGWAQMAWMLVAGRVFFGIQWAQHGWVLFWFLTLFALACASLGMFFGTLFRDPDKCRGLAIWTAILLAPLGGLWWPIELVGPTLKRVSHLVPTGWAMEPINAMLGFGAGARDVLPFALALAALFAVTFALAARRLEVT